MIAKSRRVKMALYLVIGCGLAIGLLAPRPPIAEVPVAAMRDAGKSEPKRTTTPPQPPGWGGETRLTRRMDGHFYATAQINGQPIELVVDTGASLIALTVDDARRAGIAVDPARFEVIGSGASGPVRGHAIVIPRIAVGGRELRNLRGVVLEGSELSLLGQNVLSGFAEVRMAGNEMILR